MLTRVLIDNVQLLVTHLTNIHKYIHNIYLIICTTTPPHTLSSTHLHSLPFTPFHSLSLQRGRRWECSGTTRSPRPRTTSLTPATGALALSIWQRTAMMESLCGSRYERGRGRGRERQMERERMKRVRRGRGEVRGGR